MSSSSENSSAAAAAAAPQPQEAPQAAFSVAVVLHPGGNENPVLVDTTVGTEGQEMHEVVADAVRRFQGRLEAQAMAGGVEPPDQDDLEEWFIAMLEGTTPDDSSAKLDHDITWAALEALAFPEAAGAAGTLGFAAVVIHKSKVEVRAPSLVLEGQPGGGLVFDWSSPLSGFYEGESGLFKPVAAAQLKAFVEPKAKAGEPKEPSPAKWFKWHLTKAHKSRAQDRMDRVRAQKVEAASGGIQAPWA